MKPVTLFAISLIALFFVACGGEDETNNSIIDQVEGTPASDDGSGAVADFDIPSVDVDGVVADFIACKESASESHACKYFPAKAICGLYGINDFRTGDHSYLDYDEVVENLDMSLWEKAGRASSQETLDRAQAAANEGRAAFTVGNDYGNIAIILPGTTSSSTKWGVKCPNSMSFFMSSPKNSFVNKGLNYAYQDKDGVTIYIRRK